MTTLQTALTVATTTTASGTLAAGQHTPVDATAGALTMTLPTPAHVGARLRVEKVDASANAVTITGTIRGVTGATLALVGQYELIELAAEATGASASWRPTAGHKTKAWFDVTYAKLTAGVVPDAQLPTRLADANLKAAFDVRVALAGSPDLLVSGTVTRDANGAATNAPVMWPDGTPGTYTADTVSAAFPGAVDAYHITYGSPATRTYTQPAVTRDPSTGAVTQRPTMTVS